MAEAWAQQMTIKSSPRKKSASERNDEAGALQKMGFSKAAVDAAQPDDDDTDRETVYYVPPDAMDSVRVFFDLSNQWNVLVGMSGIYWQSIKRNEIERSMRALEITSEYYPLICRDIKTMESAALPLLNQK